MNIPFLCVLIAWLLIWPPRWAATISLIRDKKYDNREPRRTVATLEGWRFRAVSAHNNGFEAFAPFAAAVLMAHLTDVCPEWLTVLSLIFVLARTAYVIAYIRDWSTLRSGLWTIAFTCNALIFLLALWTCSQPCNA